MYNKHRISGYKEAAMKKNAIEHTRLLVLSLLAGEDMYGYQMIVELARRSNHTFDMKEGTLYPVLHGLEQEGFVEAYRQEAPSGRERKYYHLTRKGQGALREEKQAWERYAGAVNDVLRGGAEAEPV
jgi:PadR family transcriptional regulator PadR